MSGAKPQVIHLQPWFESQGVPEIEIADTESVDIDDDVANLNDLEEFEQN